MLNLPKNRDGIPYISYSQYTNWNSEKSFNLRIPGKYEYILQYFFGEEYPDMGWAQFGSEVEEYICERKHGDKFTDMEKVLLESIEPLGVFQKEILIEYDGFGVLGYIDDATKDFKHIRDYKTCSKNSSKKYYKEDYYQLDLYAMWVEQAFGYLPDTMEVLMIEREGNPFKGGGRDVLQVGMEHWSHFRHTNRERLNWLREDIRRTAYEISRAWEIYQKMLKL